MIPLLVFGGLIWLAGQVTTWAAANCQVAADRTVWLWLLPVLSWSSAIYFDGGQMGAPLIVPIVATTLTLLVLGVWRPGLILRGRPSLFLCTAILLAILDWKWKHYTKVGSLCVALGFLLACQPVLLSWLRRQWQRAPWWCLCIGLCISLWFHLNRLLPETYLFASLRGVSIGLFWELAHAADGEVIDMRAPFHRQWWGPVLFAALAITLLWQALYWFLLVIAIAVVVSLTAPGVRRSHPLNGAVLAAVLMLAALPNIVWQPRPDIFHDGQVLSAVWEFESGRKLFTDVFPLRLTEFFLVWISRMVYPKSLCGSELLLQFAWPIVTAGGCLAAYAWTRSPIWSMAIGLLCSPWITNSIFRIQQPPATSPLAQMTTMRDGLVVLLLGLSMELLRSRKRKWWYAQSLIGLLSLLCGYDLMTAVIPPGAAAVFLAPCGRGGFRWPGRRFLTGLLNAAWLVGLPVSAFTLFIGIWQGWNSARDYWSLFFDFSRNYPAMIGNRLQLFTPTADSSMPMMVWNLLCLGVFGGAGILAWKSSSSAHRRMWVYALLSSAIYLHRALGRSDVQHIAGCVHLCMVLFGLLSFDAARFLVRHGPSLSGLNLQNAGLILLAGLAWCMRAGPASPLQFVTTLASVPAVDLPDLSPNTELNELVGPDEFLFPVENGLLSYVQHRRNPTRHAIAHCIGSPSEQRRALRDLQRRRTPVVTWDFWDIDEISGFNRYYILSPYLLRNYRPAKYDFDGNVRWTVLSGQEWQGQVDLPDSLLEVESLNDLPGTWGKKRWPSLSRKILRDQPIQDNWKPESAIVPAVPVSKWIIRTRVEPRRFNYLLLTLTTKSAKPKNATSSAGLFFSPDRNMPRLPQMTFALTADGLAHDYLIPIGCHPAWSWRQEIQQLRLQTEPDIGLLEPIARVIEIDDSLE
jgi:hypothetical protein